MKVGWWVGMLCIGNKFYTDLKTREDGAFENYKVVHL